MVPYLARRRESAVLHSLGNTGPLWPGIPHVLSVLDVSFFTTNTLGAVSSFGHRQVVSRAARRADVIATISRAARQDVVRVLGLPLERCVVTPLAPRPVDAAPVEDVRDRFRLGDHRVVLCVGAKRPHKNQELLIRALPAAARRGPSAGGPSRSLRSPPAGARTRERGRGASALRRPRHRRRAGGAVASCRLCRVPYGRRRLRAAGGGGDGARRARRVLRHRGPTRGRGRRAALLRSARCGRGRRRDPRRHGGRRRDRRGRERAAAYSWAEAARLHVSATRGRWHRGGPRRRDRRAARKSASPRRDRAARAGRDGSPTASPRSPDAAVRRRAC